MVKKNNTIQWTAAQRAAIETVGRDVLVTASAGTGKTAVLSARVVARICDPHDPAQADRLLVLTFTDAAAEEMRSRIAETLRARFAAERDEALRRQLLLLDRGYISTIHAFCKRILTEFFYLIDLDPGFGILDADEQRLLKTELLETTLQQAWTDEDLAQGLQVLFEGRRIQPGTGSFVDRILPLSAFLDSVVSRDAFYERAAALNDSKQAACAELKAMQKEILLEKLALCEGRLAYALSADAAHCDGLYATEYIRAELMPAIEQCRMLLEADRFDLCAALAADFDFGRMPPFRKAQWDEACKELIKGPADAVKATLKQLADFAVLCGDYETALAPQVSLQTNVLLELLRRFDAAYAAAKRARNVLDFADLEHAMLRLLERRPEVVGMLRQRFEYIFVDEYQDINAVQQRIIETISRDDNVFVVGDIKQSIYGFRQSKPAIFLERLQQAEPIETAGLKEAEKRSTKDGCSKSRPNRCLSLFSEGARGAGRVDLRANFRCRGEIIEFVNALFGAVMTRGVADMDYDARAALKPGTAYPPFTADGGPGHPVELSLLDEDSREPDECEGENGEAAEPTESVSAAQRQAAFIARRIRRMVGAESGRAEFTITAKKTGAVRPVEYRDIVILMRSLSHKAQDYVEMLRLAGVPVSSQSACGYFEATEISDCLCLLKVLDNADRDIELAALLRSPIFGLTDSALASIRLNAEENPKSDIRNPKWRKPSQGGQIQNSNTECSEHNLPTGNRRHILSFYQAVLVYADNGPDETLRSALNMILAELNQWRRQVRQGSLADLLDRVFREKGLLSFYAALPNGSQRRANLLKLHDHAIGFEHFRTTEPGQTLGRFVEFLEKLAETEQDWAPAEPDSSSENAVRIMSVHKSKGLEFPVVFAVELNAPFNRRSAAGECLIDEQTVGLQIVDRSRGGRFASLAHQVVAERQRRCDLAEEMRILYVALTRAREKLVVTAGRRENACVDLLRQCAGFGGKLPDWKLTEANCHLDWVLMGLGRSRGLCGLYGLEGCADDALFIAERIGRGELDALTETIRQQKRALQSVTTAPPAGSEAANRAAALFERIRENLQWRYPFAAQSRQEAKLSVSEWTHRDDEFAQADLRQAFVRKPAVVSRAAPPSRGADALSLGSAVHLIVEHLDLKAPVDAEAVQRTAARLVGQHRLESGLLEHLDLTAIAAFFDSELGQLAQAAGEKTLREWPFTYGLEAVMTDSEQTPTPLSGAQKGATPNGDRETLSEAENQGQSPIIATGGSLLRSKGMGKTKNSSASPTPLSEAQRGAAPRNTQKRGQEPFSSQAREVVVLQGIVDMIIPTDAGLVIVDFKTDRVTADAVAERAAHYTEQLRLYARAAGDILNRPVAGAWLYFVQSRKSVQVQLSP